VAWESGETLLRISVEQNGNALSYVLEGRLVGPWVDELRLLCEEKTNAAKGLQVTVDLCGLTAMDAPGQRLLDELMQRGATLRCADVMNQYLVEQMSSASGPFEEACRPCRRFASQSDFSAAANEVEIA
jgi:hypothetical protein